MRIKTIILVCLMILFFSCGKRPVVVAPKIVQHIYINAGHYKIVLIKNCELENFTEDHIALSFIKERLIFVGFDMDNGFYVINRDNLYPEFIEVLDSYLKNKVKYSEDG